MWVRTQDRERIVKVDHISASETGNILGFQGAYDADGIVLGSYGDRALAIAVLNKINRFIENASTKDEIVQGVRKGGIGVFRMPTLEKLIEKRSHVNDSNSDNLSKNSL